MDLSGFAEHQKTLLEFHRFHWSQVGPLRNRVVLQGGESPRWRFARFNAQRKGQTSDRECPVEPEWQCPPPRGTN